MRLCCKTIQPPGIVTVGVAGWLPYLYSATLVPNRCNAVESYFMHCVHNIMSDCGHVHTSSTYVRMHVSILCTYTWYIIYVHVHIHGYIRKYMHACVHVSDWVCWCLVLSIPNTNKQIIKKRRDGEKHTCWNVDIVSQHWKVKVPF